MELSNKVKRDSRGMGTHQRTVGITQDWITPRSLLSAIGTFDLDPCASMTQPWPMAGRSFTVQDDGLKQKWGGVVWLNPPYDRNVIGAWLARLADHDDGGMALIFARTETEWFHKYVWGAASAVYFFSKRINFYTPQGVRSTFNSGAPSCLVAYGWDCTERLRHLTREPCGWPGFFISLEKENA